MRLVRIAAVAGVLLTLATVRAGASERGVLFSVRPALSGVVQPTYVAAAPGEPGRLWIAERAGRILLLERGRLRSFLDLRLLVRPSYIEQGLLSLAFHPGYPRDPRFYVYYTDTNGNLRIVEYRADASGTRALAGTARRLLLQPHPFKNHNGGQLAFGPDGRLYAGLGDGGSEGDPQNRAQNLHTLLGKLIALDVDHPGARWQIVAYGLRNPWRFSFDPAGDLWLADVGQNAWEEVDYVPRASLHPLLNFGWSVYEGRARYKRRPLTPGGRLVWPLYVYGHVQGNCSITGGYLYRGRYVFGDYCSGAVWSLRLVGGRAVDVRREPIHVAALSSFGRDGQGRLYAASLRGTIYLVQ